MKKLLKRIGFVLLITMFVGLMGCGGAKNSSTSSSSDSGTSKKLQEIKDKGTLVVGSSGDAPFAYIDQQTGEFKGVDAEIIKEVAKRLGIEKVEMKLIPFSELIVNLNSDNIDVIADCMYIKKERAKQIYYGDVWYTQGGGLIVPQDSKVNSVEDFDPSKAVVGYTPGTIWQGIVEGWAEKGLISKAISSGDQTESIVALQYGKMDAFLTDSTVAEDLFSNSPKTVEGLRLAENYKDDEASIGHIAPAVAFGNEDFMKEINDVVKELRDEGFIEKVFKDYGLDPKLHMITNDERVYEPQN
ncbi:MAG: transporter substrate-binding domain-containing protein [Clostridiales bacterium]|nr:transporter substrate-binding domain-containing protein [Clostridiales bacterium]